MKVINTSCKVKAIAYLASVIALASCNSGQCPDILSYEDYSKQGIELPYVLDIKNGTKRLVYYGARHSFDPADSMFIDIEKRFYELDPDLVFNEGGDGWPEIADRDSTIILTGDPGFTRYLGRKSKAVVKSIEPPDSAEYAYLLSKFNKNDVVLMYACRQIDQFRQQEGVTDSTFTAYMEFFLNQMRDNGMPLNDNEVRMDHVKAHYQALLKSPLNWKTFDPTIYYPTHSQTLLNEIMRESTYFRDRYIISQLQQAFKRSDKIFIVMGGSHLVIEEPALKCMMENLQ